MQDRKISEGSLETLQNILTEEEVKQLTGLSKGQLDVCRREKRLPFLKVNQNCRLYLESDVVQWLKSQRTVLNAET